MVMQTIKAKYKAEDNGTIHGTQVYYQFEDDFEGVVASDLKG